MEVLKPVKRNVLLNPGPATTTDTVKYAQIVPDICPREKEFGDIMREISAELLKIVHASPDAYSAVLFCGSGTINIDVLMNSLVPEGKKALVINNGAYSARAAEVLSYYQIPYLECKFDYDERPDLNIVEKTLKENPDIAVVHCCHNETGTGLLNPIREIGALVHKIPEGFYRRHHLNLGNAPHRYGKRQSGFCHGILPEGADGNDRSVLYRWKDKVD